MPERARCLRLGAGHRGLAEDVRYYGEWMKQEAFKRIGHLYPKGEGAPGTGRRRGHRHRLDLGQDSEVPQPGLRVRDAPDPSPLSKEKEKKREYGT